MGRGDEIKNLQKTAGSGGYLNLSGGTARQETFWGEII